MTGTSTALAAEFLRAGKVVGIPTETVYGLAANAFNEDAVISVFKIKKRPFFDPLIIHTHSIERVESYVLDFPVHARKLAEQFWPGPLTLLLPKTEQIPDIVTSGSDLVAIRIPKHPLTLELLAMLD
jgi:L-threonylcarbamoyladenylate synthase